MPDKERQRIIASFFAYYKAMRKENKPRTKSIDETVYEVFSDEDKSTLNAKVKQGKENVVPTEAEFKTIPPEAPKILNQLGDVARELEGEAKNPEADPKKTISLANNASLLVNSIGNDIQQYQHVQVGGEEGVSLARVGLMNDTVRNVINTSVAVVGAAMSWVRAERMQAKDIECWLGQELLTHHMVGEKLNELENLRKILQEENPDKTLKVYDEKELADFEKKLFLKREIEKYQHGSILKYRGKVQGAMDRLGSEVLDEENDKIVNLLIQLEIRHAKRKIQLVENAISARLEVKLESGELRSKKAKDIISTYHDDSAFAKSLAKTVEIGTHKSTPEQRKLNTAIENKLQVIAVKKRKDMAAKTLLLVSAILAVSCILAAIFMPPAAPLLIGLAVGALVALGAAKLLRPDISKIFTQGSKKFADNYKEEVGFWKAKKQIKESQDARPIDTAAPDPTSHPK